MPLIATCPVHGQFPVGNLFGGTANMRLTNVSTSCPVCGRRSAIADGNYSMVNDVIRALRSPGVGTAEILQFQSIAEAVRDGHISAEEGQERFTELENPLVGLWKWTNANAGALSVLLTLITLYLTWASAVDATRSNNQLSKELQTHTQIERMMLNELKKISAEGARRMRSGSAKYTYSGVDASQPQTFVGNRADRRKAAAKQRRLKKSVISKTR